MVGLIAVGVTGFLSSCIFVNKFLEDDELTTEEKLIILFSDLGIMDVEKDWIRVYKDEMRKGYRLLELELSGTITSHNFKNKLLQLQEKFNTPYVKITYENNLLVIKIQNPDFPYEEYKYVPCSPTQILLGHNMDYEPVFWSLYDATNLCIAGATGVGKSTIFNTAIINCLKSGLFELDLIDLKKGVEFFNYRNKKGVLHYGETPEEAEEIFKLFFEEFERRTALLRKGDKQYANLDAYLEDNSGVDIKRRILVVDEWALLAVIESTKMGKSEKLSPLMNNIAILASQIRFAGMHLMVATQRPSKEIMNGIIKANFKLLGMRVLNEINSKIIIDVEGLESIEKHTLLGELNGEWTEIKAYYLDNKQTMKLVDELEERDIELESLENLKQKMERNESKAAISKAANEKTLSNEEKEILKNEKETGNILSINSLQDAASEIIDEEEKVAKPKKPKKNKPVKKDQVL